MEARAWLLPTLIRRARRSRSKLFNKAGILVCLFAATRVQGADFLLYAGTYTNAGSKGIYAYRFQTRTGKLNSLGLVAATSNPSSLGEHPSPRCLTAVNEGRRFT